MGTRPKLRQRVGSYFARPKDEDDVDFFSSGSKTLDMALGGGWAVRRVANVIGDASTGKTLLAIEASANFALKFPKGRIRYREPEHAFQERYAEAIGMPLDRVDFGDEPMWTVEDLFEELTYRAEHSKQPELFIVDSLDALTSRSEAARDIDEASFGGEKAKKMSELFRRLIGKMEDRDITLMIISQVRDNIGVKFGRKWTVTGGKALGFYSSQRLVLAHLGQVSKTRNKIKRTVGIEVKGNLIKNKVGLAYREAQFEVLFGWGIDDAKSCIAWLKSNGGHVGPAIGNMKEDIFLNMIYNNSGDWKNALAKLHKAVEARWYEIEEGFLTKGRKYGS